MRSYMFLFWAPRQALAMPRSPEQARASGEKWHSWEQALRKGGHSPTGAQLEPGGQCLTGAARSLREGTFGKDDVCGGYFMVTASSLAEATELAKGCPLLDNGGTVEVRAVMEV